MARRRLVLLIQLFGLVVVQALSKRQVTGTISAFVAVGYYGEVGTRAKSAWLFVVVPRCVAAYHLLPSALLRAVSLPNRSLLPDTVCPGFGTVRRLTV